MHYYCLTVKVICDVYFKDLYEKSFLKFLRDVLNFRTVLSNANSMTMSQVTERHGSCNIFNTLGGVGIII